MSQLRCAGSCDIQGHVSLDPHGQDAPSSHATRLRYAGSAPFPCGDPSFYVSVGTRTRSLHLLRYVSPPYLTPSLTRCGTIAAQVGRPFHTDTRASCVSVGYRHGSPHLLRLAEAMCHGMSPSHEGDTHRTLKPSTLMYLRCRYAIVPDAQRWLQSS